jgi:hypothetical protein
MPSVAKLIFGLMLFNKKNNGTPTIAASPKQIICLFVKFRNTLVLTFVKSLGIDIYADISSPS